MRVLFCGTGDIGLPSLQALAGSAAHELVGVVTQPDRPAGRDMKPRASVIKSEAVACGLPVLQPERIRHEESALIALSSDVMVVMAYGQILPSRILKIPRLGCLNLHASLLPRHRGASLAFPAQRPPRAGSRLHRAPGSFGAAPQPRPSATNMMNLPRNRVYFPSPAGGRGALG